MSADVKIRPARPDEVIDLRWELLRAGLPRETAKFEGDDDPTTLHFAALSNDEVVGCATFMRRPLEDRPAWQLRGMAVRPDVQRSGIGRKMLDFAEVSLRDNGYSVLLWCNARTSAMAFYERLGWQTISDVFEIRSAGPHVKMIKHLR